MSEAQVKIIYKDPPVHCIDVRDSIGQRAIRIRPTQEGATFDFTGAPVHLSKADLAELARALDRLSQ